ncbi:hypothetical protein KSX_04490 [Ktedonospora formicarum]|uniref:Uncharacterized protein n=1 Tax=Ktedonospora formicarum TaxID=2778364 RepID=A0A8J3HUM2_9CHLR|nr:hypothetical protein KSX_04490 [Ktedonospora formicarum]
MGMGACGAGVRLAYGSHSVLTPETERQRWTGHSLGLFRRTEIHYHPLGLPESDLIGILPLMASSPSDLDEEKRTSF